MANSYFSSETFKFLTELEQNNNRDWFAENKARYEDVIRGRMLDFVADFGEQLEQFAPHFEAIPKKMGGSLIRIYRDLRFSNDKTPYKTNIGIHFRHELAKDMHAPGYYLHVDGLDVFLGAGIWRPQSKSVKQIRGSIDECPEKWIKAINNKRFTSSWMLSGSSLTNPPRGYHKDHPMISDLKRKDFIAVIPLSRKALYSKTFVTDIASEFKKAEPLMAFLCRALDVPF